MVANAQEGAMAVKGLLEMNQGLDMVVQASAVLAKAHVIANADRSPSRGEQQQQQHTA